MGNIGDPFTTAIPAVGSPGTAYATDINAILTEVMARLSAKIPLSSLLGNSSVDLNGQAILNAAYLHLVNGSAAASPINRIGAVAGDLYWFSSSGAVQITSGGSIAIAGAGGITGDYGTGPEQFRFTNVDQRFDAYDDFAGGAWAYIRARAFDVAAGATSAFRARLSFAGAANRDYTLPAAPPGVGTTILGMDSAGVMSANPSLDQDITLTGSAMVRHGNYVCTQAITTGMVQKTGGTDTFAATPSGVGVRFGGATGVTAIVTLNGLDTRHTLRSVVLRTANVPTASVGYALKTQAGNSVTLTSVVGATGDGSANTVTLTPTTPFTMATGTVCYLEVVTAGVAFADLLTTATTYSC